MAEPDYAEINRRNQKRRETAKKAASTPSLRTFEGEEPRSYFDVESTEGEAPELSDLRKAAVQRLEETDVIDPDYTGDPADYYDSEEYGRKASASLDARDALAAARDHMGVQSIEIPQSQAEASQRYQNILEEMKVDAGARGQATTKPEPKPEPKPPTRSGYARVTAGERETYFAPWETEGMTDEELMRIGAHPSQKKTLPPMDTTRKHTVADKERRAQQVAERQAAGTGYANEGGFDFSTVDTSATREKIAGLDRAAKDANLADTNTDIYKEHLPKELHNNPDALREAAKDAAAENYFNMMEKHGSEQGWADVEIDGEPWKETWFKDGETFFVSEDESQILRAPDAQKS